MTWWQGILATLGSWMAIGAGVIAGELVPRTWTEASKRRVQWCAGIFVLFATFWFVEGTGGDLHQISRMRVGDLVFRLAGLAIFTVVLVGLIALCHRLFKVLKRTYGQSRFWIWASNHAVAIYFFCFFIVLPTTLYAFRALGYGY